MESRAQPDLHPGRAQRGMAPLTTGFLHPGAMGARLGATCSGSRLWVSHGRSTRTRERALGAGMVDVGTLGALVSGAECIVSICPPGAATEVARAVADAGFDGVYVDANAIAPATARDLGELFTHYVDGGVIGPPPQSPGTTRFYLSGPRADEVALRWHGSELEVRVLGASPAAASAVKACFAAWTKGTAALVLAIRALARAEGVEDALIAEWEVSIPELATSADRAATGTGPKAWRFVEEMHQIAAAFAHHDLPDGFHRAAAELYGRLAGFKDVSPGPTLESVLAALLAETGEGMHGRSS